MKDWCVAGSTKTAHSIPGHSRAPRARCLAPGHSTHHEQKHSSTSTAHCTQGPSLPALPPLPGSWTQARCLPGATWAQLFSHPSMKWQTGGKPLLSTSSSVTNSLDFITQRWETKPSIWLNWKKRKKLKKRVLSVRYAPLNDSTGCKALVRGWTEQLSASCLARASSPAL